MKLDDGAEIIFPSITYLYGIGVKLRTATETRTLDCDGQLTGVNQLTVSRGSSLFLDVNFHTAFLDKLDPPAYLYVDQNGEFRFAIFDVKSQALVKAGPDGVLKGSVAVMSLRFEAVLSAETVKLAASVVNVEKGARISASVADRLYDTLDDETGQGVDGTYFSGGGHASPGGYYYNTDNSLLAAGGEPYGDVFNPKTRGSRGGIGTSGGSPGKGAGIVEIVAAVQLFVDGVIEANGGDASGNNGGGSAGSVNLRAGTLEGHGEFKAIGGSGVVGGSGGLIAAYTDSEHFFHGDVFAYGGAGSLGRYIDDGGPGVTYMEDIRYTEVYSVMQINNKNYDWDQCFTLGADGSTSEFTLNELHLFAAACLQLAENGNDMKLDVKKLYGDQTGRLYAKENHEVALEQGETSETIMKLPINLWLDDGAKAYLATTTYIKGTGAVAFRFNGEIIGVQNLRIMPRRVVEVGSTAMTSSETGGDYSAGTPGKFTLNSFELGSYCLLEMPPPMAALFEIVKLVSFTIICKSSCKIR